MTMQILITGATGSIGRALCQHFVSVGHGVIGLGRSQETLSELSAAASAHFTGIELDLTNVDAASALVEQLDDRKLRPTALVNSARSIESLAIGSDGIVSRQSFLDEYLLDVVVPYELTMALARQRDSALRSVVNVGSMYGSVAANPGLYDDYERQSPIQYGVAKAALVHLTKELAVRLAPRLVSVNCVAYGGVEGRANAAFMGRYAKLSPSGRMLKHSELAAPVEMLLTHATTSMTGQTIHADGGWTLW